MIESATFWKDSPEVETGEIVPARVPDRGVLLPGRLARREGRHVHQDPAAAAVAGEGGRAAGRPALRAVVLLPPRPAGPGPAGRLDRPARPPDPGPQLGVRDQRRTGLDAEPSAESVLKAINGYGPDGLLDGYTDLKADGSTACGCWIYSGVYAKGVNQAGPAQARATSRTAPSWSGAGPGRWTGGSSTTAPPPTRTAGPWSERKKYVWWDEDAGPVDRPATCPTSRRPSRRRTGRRRTRSVRRRCAGTTRSSCRPTARAGCSCRTGCRTGRCRPTTSRTSRRSATRSTASRATRPARSTAATTTRRTRRRRRRTARSSRTCCSPRG